MATFSYLMPVPAISSLIESTDFSKTVLSYLPQLYDFPTQVYHSLGSLEALRSLYLTTNPFISGLSFCLLTAPLFFLAGEINRNYSQVDRFWSILPTLYNAHYAVYAHTVGIPTERLDLLLIASFLWSSRLSYNYWRKGGYSKGSEDYRWEVLRKYISPPLFVIFDVVFISLLQSLLLFSITTPTYILLLASQTPLAPFTPSTDIVFASALVLFVSGAHLADGQQWNFHGAKATYKSTGKPSLGYNTHSLDLGFNTSGLWKYSRHPNFVFEQAFWLTVYTWGCYTTGTYWNWTVIGAVCYLLLFQASTWFTELITERKYAEYKEYQKRVGKFLPTGLGWTKPGDLSDVKRIEGQREEKKEI